MPALAARRAGPRVSSRGSSTGLSRFRPRAYFPVAPQGGSERTPLARKCSAHARGWLSAGRHRRHDLLELSGRRRLRLWLGPAQRPQTQDAAAASELDAAGVQAAFPDVRRFRSGGPARRTDFSYQRPLRVRSADVVDLMRGFAERYRNESTLALDLLIDSADLHAPDRVCRELFQIYREALNNIKKHAKASHVVVKLTQDDSRLVLVVDDNGEGFSFAGRFTGDDLDRLRLGPISIKERTRTVAGALTLDANPCHGARLILEIPPGRYC